MDWVCLCTNYLQQPPTCSLSHNKSLSSISLLKKNESNKFSFTNKHSQKIYRTMGIRQVLWFHNCCYQKIREPFLTYNHHFPKGKKKKTKTPKKNQKHAQPETHCSLPIPPKKLEPAVLWFLDFQNTKLMGVFKYLQALHNRAT
jgi:hypothetical protein